MGNVRLIRFKRFDGKNLHFMDNVDPTRNEILPLAAAYHPIADKIPEFRLCRATIVNGEIIALALTSTRPPPAGKE